MSKNRKYRKSDSGIAIVQIKYPVMTTTILKAVHNNNLKIRNTSLMDGDYFLVSGIWKDIRRLKKLRFVKHLIFESDRKPLITNAD